jgi:hypothetical protein
MSASTQSAATRLTLRASLQTCLEVLPESVVDIVAVYAKTTRIYVATSCELYEFTPASCTWTHQWNDPSRRSTITSMCGLGNSLVLRQWVVGHGGISHAWISTFTPQARGVQRLVRCMPGCTPTSMTARLIPREKERQLWLSNERIAKVIDAQHWQPIGTQHMWSRLVVEHVGQTLAMEIDSTGGRLQGVAMYLPDARDWQSLPGSRSMLGFHPESSTSVAVLDGWLYCLTGWLMVSMLRAPPVDTRGCCERLWLGVHEDVGLGEQQQWQLVAQVPGTAYATPHAAVAEGKLFVLGVGNGSTEVYQYDVQHDAWQKLQTNSPKWTTTLSVATLPSF